MWACDYVQDSSVQQDTRRRKAVLRGWLPPRHLCKRIQQSMNHLVQTVLNVNKTLPQDMQYNLLQKAAHLCHQMYPEIKKVSSILNVNAVEKTGLYTIRHY